MTLLSDANPAEQRVPPYVIFNDATLMAIARERPASTNALAKISGVGQSKLKRYGADALKVVRANRRLRRRRSNEESANDLA